MWRRNFVVYFILLHRHIASQPITELSTNDRPTRQLDFEECCPCFGKSDEHRDAGSEEPLGDASEGILSRAQPFDDCPCRGTDSQPAASVFFPAMRTAGAFLRPGEKKEDLKPIFNPEVDLASSVLQTLRDVTDEEYKDALARDAAKSAAKAAEDMFNGDAIPQESAHIVTVVVNPSLSDADDIIPQAPNIKQSRCIHPLQSNVGKFRMAPKSNLFVYKPRSKVKPGLLHKVMDNGMGASNVYEQRIPLTSNDETFSNDVSPLRILDSQSVNNNAQDSLSKDKLSNPESESEKYKILGLNRSPLLESIRNKINSSLSRTPKSFKNILLDKTKYGGDDLSSAPSIINQQTVKRVPYLFKPNSVLENIKQKSRPLSLSNLLNLKDVEMVPITDLIKSRDINKMDKSNFIPSTRVNNDKSFNDDYEEPDSMKKMLTDSKNNAFKESSSNPEEGSSGINYRTLPIDERTSDNNCEITISKPNSDINDKRDDLKLNPSTDITMQSDSMENKKDASTENNYCTDKDNIDQDLKTGASNTIEQKEAIPGNYVILPEEQARPLDVPSEAEYKNAVTTSDSLTNNENTSKFKLLDHSFVDKTISNIKENIAKKFEDLKNFKHSISNKETLNEKESSIPRNENTDLDCENEASIQLTTRLPGGFSDELSINQDVDCDDEATIQVTSSSPEIFGENSQGNLDPDFIRSSEIFINKPEENLTPDCQDEEGALQITTALPQKLNNNADNNLAPDCEDSSIQSTLLTQQSKIVGAEEVTTTIDPDLFDSFKDIGTMKEESSHSLEDLMTLKPDVVSDARKDNGFDKTVSMQDLQKLSDSMLQQEEKERQTQNEDCDILTDDVVYDPSKSNSGDTSGLDSEKSANSVTNVVQEPINLVNLQESKHVDQVCKGNEVTPKSILPAIADASVDASNIVLSSISKSDDSLSSQPILQPTQDFLQNPLPNVSNLLKLPPFNPLPGIENIKTKLTNLFEKKVGDADILSSETKIISNTKDSSIPVMTPAASTNSLQLNIPTSRLLKDLSFNRLDLKPSSSVLPDIPNFDLQSYKSKLSLPKDLSLKPSNLQSAIGDNQNFLPSTSSIGEKLNLINKNKENFQSRNTASNILNHSLNVKPRTGVVKQTLSDFPHEATNNIHLALKNTQKAFQSRLRQNANNNFNLLNSPFKGSPGLLDSLSRNHEDIGDKLKGLQMDLNDRLETMRNDFIDRSKLLTSPRNSKQNFNKINKNKKVKQPFKATWQASSRRESQKLASPLKAAQQKPVKIVSPQKSLKQKTFRMPGAASVPVPSTIAVPELKTAENPVSFTSNRAPSMISNWDGDVPKTREPLETARKQSSFLQNTNPSLRKKFDVKKDNKVIVSFSTTPRTAEMNHFRSSSPYLQGSNTATVTQIGNKDYNGPPIESIKSTISRPISENLNSQKHLNVRQESEQSSPNLAEGRLSTPEVGKLSTKNLQSWPRLSERSFLTKVKEAVQTRLSKVNSPKGLLQVKQEKYDKELANSALDMTRSATENKETVAESPLKENVSYKCKMVCVKEHI